jgi:hypothetical protein
MFRCVRLASLVFVALAVIPTAAYAQASITGVVKDTSGAVLPGVTVEAASPALIEKVRAGVTDGTGQYRIENLRPGAYVVTFTLPGFATVRREGIELTGTFTATVNADLRVGALEETITVTGEAPTVDVQTVKTQYVLDQETLDSLPSSRVASSMVTLLPGVTNNTPDVGGINGDGGARGSSSVRGNSDTRAIVAGVPNYGASGSSGGGNTVMNIAAYQEIAVDTGGVSLEQKEGGIRINLIPRDGGNTFSGHLFANFANHAMQGSNFTQELRDRGLRTPNTVNRLSEFNPSFGGPIKRDRLWFYWSARHSGAFQNVPMFFNKNAGDPTKWTYEADTSRPVADRSTTRNFTTLRVTWQATPKHKLAVTADPSDNCDCPRGSSATVAPEANAGNYVISSPKSSLHGEWTAPITNRLLLEAGLLRHWSFTARPHVNPNLPQSDVQMIAVQEQSSGLRYRATADAHEARGNTIFGLATLSYITGAHAFKVGFNYGTGSLETTDFSTDAPIEFRFNEGVPNRMTLFATDTVAVTKLDADHGVFVQDRWTVRRVTLTAGMRFDLMRVSYPEMPVSPTPLAPTRDIVLPRGEGIRWNDWEPRAGLAYDVFGDGKTALKVSGGKYLIGTYLRDGSRDLTGSLSPVLRLVTSTTRSWNDANRNYVPDCDLLAKVANGECGALANPNFGSTQGATSVDPDVITGWNKRQYNWQFDIGMQRELVPRVSAGVSYWRSSWGNQLLVDNRSLGATDFDPFSLTAPVDPRLPGGGGYALSGLYNIKPARFGIPADNIWTFAKKLGKQTEVWNGVDFTFEARPQAGIRFQGGVTTQRQTTDNCDLLKHLDNPSQLFCHVTGTFLTQLKMVASYTVPRIDVQVSGSLQNLPGPAITASYVASLAEVQPSLGRPLAGGERNVTVGIVEPRSMYGQRRNQVDLRIGKILHFGHVVATPTLDVYNALNANPVTALSSAFATWQRPEEILQARFVKVGLQLGF